MRIVSEMERGKVPVLRQDFEDQAAQYPAQGKIKVHLDSLSDQSYL